MKFCLSLYYSTKLEMKIWVHCIYLVIDPWEYQQGGERHLKGKRKKTRKTCITEQVTMVGNWSVAPLEDNESWCSHRYTNTGQVWRNDLLVSPIRRELRIFQGVLTTWPFGLALKINLAYILGQKKHHIQVDVFRKWTYCVWWVQWSWGCASRSLHKYLFYFILFYVYLFCKEKHSLLI